MARKISDLMRVPMVLELELVLAPVLVLVDLFDDEGADKRGPLLTGP